jgi:predicted metalloprotease with PDZ domain
MLRILLMLVLFIPPALRSEDQYQVEFNRDLKQVDVQACFDGAAPRRIYRHAEAGRFTKSIFWGEQKIYAAGSATRVTLPRLPPDSCIKWQLDLTGSDKESDQRTLLHLEDSVVTNGNLWFWRDGERRPIRVQVTLPAGYSISAPWKTLSNENNKPTFQVDPTPSSWTSRIAVGRFPIQNIEVAGTHIRLATIGRVSRQQRAKLASWMTTTAESVSLVFGHFPRSQPQILIVPIGSRNEAVPWAHVVRGGGIASEFFVDETRSLREFNSDWTATHELSHMLLPYISSKDRWLSEGLASYYQNVLRARDGRLTEKQAWQRLHSGFQRGLAGTKPASSGESLAEATRSGWDSTMRVYWSGAAMMLEADARLRSRSQGKQSLDTALAALYQCCFDGGKRWRAQEVFDRLDQLTGYEIFSDIYSSHVMNHDFPDLSQTYENLGIVPVNNSIRLKADAPWGRIRHFIMSDKGTAITLSGSTGAP